MAGKGVVRSADERVRGGAQGRDEARTLLPTSSAISWWTSVPASEESSCSSRTSSCMSEAV